jgi:hypothetical protein
VPGTEDFVQQIRDKNGFQVTSHSIEAYGLCARCARRVAQEARLESPRAAAGSRPSR